MNHPALEELSKIIKEESLSSRDLLLNEWKNKWLYHTENTQHVVNKSVLTNDDTDFVWYKIAQMCAEDLIDNKITETTTTNNSFSCSIVALRSPDAKLKTDTKSIKRLRNA